MEVVAVGLVGLGAEHGAEGSAGPLVQAAQEGRLRRKAASSLPACRQPGWGRSASRAAAEPADLRGLERCRVPAPRAARPPAPRLRPLRAARPPACVGWRLLLGARLALSARSWRPALSFLGGGRSALSFSSFSRSRFTSASSFSRSFLASAILASATSMSCRRMSRAVGPQSRLTSIVRSSAVTKLPMSMALASACSLSRSLWVGAVAVAAGIAGDVAQARDAAAENVLRGGLHGILDPAVQARHHGAVEHRRRLQLDLVVPAADALQQHRRGGCRTARA